MRTFGRVIGVLGLALAAAGALGALALQPPAGLEGAAEYLEETRQAVRSKVPEMPPLGALLAGSSEGVACAAADGAEADEGAEAQVACGQQAPQVMTRNGGGGASRFKTAVPGQP